MHTLLDTIVDDYEEIAEDQDVVVEQMEEAPARRPAVGFADRSVQDQAATRDGSAATPCRCRACSPASSSRGSVGANIALVDAQFGAYFRDVYDHTLRIIDQLRNVQELTDALIELVRVEATNTQNEVTKRLTGWAAIIAVPTYIASVYGMNFELVPQHGQVEGFYFALALMAASAVGLYTYFKKREWI